jgi:hypothetical protein
MRKSSHGNVSSIGQSNVFKRLRSGTGHGLSGERQYNQQRTAQG